MAHEAGGGTMHVRRSITAATGLTLVLTALVGLDLGVTAAGAAPAPAAKGETISGLATIPGAPPGWSPSNFYVVLCPADVSFALICPGQRDPDTNQSNGSFKVKVPAQAWDVGVYYYTVDGQQILGKGVKVAAQPGQAVTQNVAVAYRVPAVQGRMRLTGAPENFGSLAYMGVQACPGRVSFRVGCGGGQEAYEDVGPGSAYLIDLAPGSWNVGAYYRNDSNTKVFNGPPVALTAVAGVTRTVNVKIAYQGV
jgi:hypothetical protein